MRTEEGFVGAADPRSAAVPWALRLFVEESTRKAGIAAFTCFAIPSVF